MASGLIIKKDVSYIQPLSSVKLRLYIPESRPNRSTVPRSVKEEFVLFQAGINAPVPPASVISILPFTLSEQLI